MKSTESNPVRRTALHYLVNIAIIVIFLLIIFNFLPVVYWEENRTIPKQSSATFSRPSLICYCPIEITEKCLWFIVYRWLILYFSWFCFRDRLALYKNLVVLKETNKCWAKTHFISLNRCVNWHLTDSLWKKRRLFLEILIFWQSFVQTQGISIDKMQHGLEY